MQDFATIHRVVLPQFVATLIRRCSNAWGINSPHDKFNVETSLKRNQVDSGELFGDMCMAELPKPINLILIQWFPLLNCIHCDVHVRWLEMKYSDQILAPWSW